MFARRSSGMAASRVVGVKASSMTSAGALATARIAAVRSAVDWASKAPAWSSRANCAGPSASRMSAIAGGAPPKVVRAAGS